MDPFSIALAAGSIGTGVAGLMRKQPNYGYSKGDLEYLAAQRSGQIDSFAKQLAELRSRYSTSLANFGNNTFNRFSGQAEANFAGRGLQVTGGAFQSALAKRASEIQDTEGLNLLNLENSDLRAVDSARGSLFGNIAGFNPSGPSADPGSMALGKLSSGLGSLALNRLNTPQSSSVNYAQPEMFNYGSLAQTPRRSVFSGQPYNKMSLGYR